MMQFARAIIADGKVSESEAKGFQAWIEANPDVIGIAAVDEIVGILTNFFSDGPGLDAREDLLQVERAWIQWSTFKHLKIKVGKFLTPYGIWNIKHDPPLLPSLITPLPVRRAIFPSRQTGIELEGEFDLGSTSRFGYAAWVGNGKGTTFFDDDNFNKAYGGRLTFTLEDAGPVTNT